MKLTTHAQRWITGTVLVAVLASTMAPVAEAGRRERVRYKGGYEVRAHRHPHSTYYVRRSSTGALIGGFLGGLFLGAVLANAAPAGYVYYDPYCNHRFASLNDYDVYYHRHRHRHPRVVRVVEVRTNRTVKEYRYSNDNWREYRDDGYRDDRDGREWNRDDREWDDDQYRDRDRDWNDDHDERWEDEDDDGQ